MIKDKRRLPLDTPWHVGSSQYIPRYAWIQILDVNGELAAMAKTVENAQAIVRYVNSCAEKGRKGLTGTGKGIR